jgi:hypothetical protein
MSHPATAAESFFISDPSHLQSMVDSATLSHLDG